MVTYVRGKIRQEVRTVTLYVVISEERIFKTRYLLYGEAIQNVPYINIKIE
jgi:hypothetical protein